MATKEQVTEYIDAQFVGDEGTEIHTYWQEQQLFVEQRYAGNRLGVIQEWMSPEVAIILQKLIGDAEMVSQIAKNRSNS
jgi:hypothetical protein